MGVFKFKKFEDLEKLEREGKGVSWRFMPKEDLHFLFGEKEYLEKESKNFRM